jgi:hypothetical protein
MTTIVTPQPTLKINSICIWKKLIYTNDEMKSFGY